MNGISAHLLIPSHGTDIDTRMPEGWAIQKHLKDIKGNTQNKMRGGRSMGSHKELREEGALQGGAGVLP